MKGENDLPKLFLIDEKANEFKPVSRSSYLKKGNQRRCFPDQQFYLLSPGSQMGHQAKPPTPLSHFCRRSRQARARVAANGRAEGMAALRGGGGNAAVATMKEENDLHKDVWIDEEANEFKPVCRSSWHNMKSGIKKIGSLILPSNRRLTPVFILFFLVLALLVVYGLGSRYPFGNNVTPIADPVPKNLTVPILQEAQKYETFCEAMENWFERAIKEFASEPQIIKENAKVILECNGTRREFVPGKGVEVFSVDGPTHDTVKEADPQAYLARLNPQDLSLNLGNLLIVYQQLASLEGSEELRQCLSKAIEQFPREPQVVQDNAILQVSCGGSNVTFRSEPGENEINVYKDEQGVIVFNVKARGGAWWARLFVKHSVKK